ncbi:MAG TPA: class I SAM-dependent methyltransferase [Polyangia bacterium]|jgi:SAM-dependent methyltransferase|nr:class I SAM-dependent methyltransferase [Polyangia bacterium]
MSADENSISVGGGDTAQPKNLAKRMDRIRAICPLADIDVLDMGCGEGAYVAAMLAEGANARGVEYDGEKVRALRERMPEFDRVTQGDIEDLPFAADSFDLVLLNEVLEHVPNQERALTEARRVLRRGGRIVLLSPNRLYPFETHGVYARRSGRRLSHMLPFVPYVPTSIGRHFLRYWARNYWPWELREAVRSAGFTIVDVGFLWQTFENISRNQPRWLQIAAPILRRFANAAERTPILRTFGVSQLVVAEPR